MLTGSVGGLRPALVRCELEQRGETWTLRMIALDGFYFEASGLDFAHDDLDDLAAVIAEGLAALR